MPKVLIPETQGRFVMAVFAFWSLLMFPISNIYACTPGACLVNGHNQDTLFLGEVVFVSPNESNDLYDVKIIHVYPQNKLRAIKKGRGIVVSRSRVLNLSDDEQGRIVPGKKYLFSLNQRGSVFYSAWGVYEISEDIHSGLSLVEDDYFDADYIDAFVKSSTPKDVAKQFGSTL